MAEAPQVRVIDGPIQLEDARVFLDNDSMVVDKQYSRFRALPFGALAARQVIQAMNVLQSSRTGSTTQLIVDRCVEFHLNYLPPETSSILEYIMVSSPDNPSPLFELNLTDEEFARNNHRFRGENKRFFDRVRNATWTILPLGVNDHFSVAILRCEKKKMPSAEGGFRTVIKDVLMADPQRNESLEQFLYMRLRLILTERRGFTFKHNNPVRMWFPTQLDHYTCGLRTFEIIRVMMMRISQSAAEAGLKDGYDPKTIWKDLSGDFQPDKVRAEMIGILANVAMRYTHWSTRVCLLPVSHVKNRTMGTLETWIGTDKCGARLSDLPRRNAMQYGDDIMVDKVLRLDIEGTPDLMQTTPDFWTQTPPGENNASNQGLRPQHPGWGTLPPRQGEPGSPPEPPATGPGSSDTPQQTGSGLPPALTPTSGPGSGLPPALTPTNVSGPGSGPSPGPSRPETPSQVPLPPSRDDTPLETPSQVPLPPSRDDTPLETPGQTRRSSSNGDEEMSGT